MVINNRDFAKVVTPSNLISSLLLILLVGLSPSSIFAQGLRRLTTEEGQLLRDLQKPRRIILSIGINSFEDPFWNSLQFAESDARSVFQVFQSELSLPFDSGELLVNQPATGPVTKEALLRAFERLKTLNVSEEDTVVVYLSTHGTIYLRKNAKVDEPTAYVPYFVAADTRHKDIQGSALSRDELLSLFQSLKSQRKALIIATCHSGGGKAQITAEISESMKRLKGNLDSGVAPLTGRGYSVLSASSWSEPAAEDDKLGHDIYTYFLMEALRNKQDGPMTLTQAHDSATRKTVAFTANMQHPTIQLDQAGGDPIVVRGDLAPGGLAYVYSYIKSLKDFELRIGGRSKGIIGEGQLTVPDGKQRLEIVEPDSQRVIATRVIRLSSGKEYSLIELIQARNRWHSALGYGFGQFLEPNFTRTFAPKSLHGSSLSLRYDGAYGLWDFWLHISRGEVPKESVRFNQQAFDQDRTMTRLFLLAGARENLHLFPFHPGWTTEWGWATGPGFLQLQRQLSGDGRLAADKPRATVVLPGWNIASHLEFQQLAGGLELGLKAELDLYASQGRVDNVRPWTAYSQLGAYIGVGW
jgi:hypothetical protein